MLVKYRRGYLYALQSVACHEVGGGYVDLAVIAAAENVYTRVLEKSADDAHNADIFGVALDTGAQTADTANDHFDLHARLRSFYQAFHYLLIGQRIELQPDVGFPALARLCRFTLDKVYHFILQAVRRYHEQICF